ncbi:MAG: hypothetical protein EXS59_02485 [Candidatus Taylorbacteria bacterium]|nr:hypothetical protein [Candidatus Taylorbacteria bacterium]
MTITSPIVVTPFATFSSGVVAGNFTNGEHCQYLHRLNMQFAPVETPKSVCFVCFEEFVGADECITKLAEIERRPCEAGANYLFGYLAEVSEEVMPTALKDKFLVAAEPGSTICDSSGNQVFLCCRREKNYRVIELASGRKGWAPRWAFLVEDSTADVLVAVRQTAPVLSRG